MSYKELCALLQSQTTLTIYSLSHTLCKRRYKHRQSSTIDLWQTVIKSAMQRELVHANTYLCQSACPSQPLFNRSNSQSVFRCLREECKSVCVCVCLDFVLTQPANPLSIPSGSDIAFSCLRQLEAITLNQQTPARLHLTKKPYAHSAYYLYQWPCVCVYVDVSVCVGAFKNLSMAIFLSLSQTSLHLQFFFYSLSNSSFSCASPLLELRSRPS